VNIQPETDFPDESPTDDHIELAGESVDTDTSEAASDAAITIDKRASERVPLLDLDVRYNRVDDNWLVRTLTPSKPVIQVVDCSLGGLAIYITEKLNNLAMLDLTMTLGEEKASAYGRVIYCRQLGQKHYKAGIELMHTPRFYKQAVLDHSNPTD